MAAPRKLVIKIALAVIGVGIVVTLIAQIGPDAIAGHLANVGFDFAWLLVAYGAGTTVTAMPWYWLLPPGARPRVADAIASRFAAAGLNALLPLFAVGGEPTRLLWLDPANHATGLAGVVVDRLLFAAASVLFLLAGLITVVQIAALPPVYTTATAALALTALAFAAGLAWLAANHGVAGRIHRIVHRVRSAPGVNLARGALGEDVDSRLGDLLKHRSGRLVGGALTHLVGRALLGAEIYAGLLVIGVPVTPAEGLVLASVPVVIAMVASWIPSQIGVQEGALAFACSLLGIDPAAGITVVVLQRIRQVGTVALAWALLSRRTARRRAS